MVPPYVATQLVTPKYESTATLALTPKSDSVQRTRSCCSASSTRDAVLRGRWERARDARRRERRLGRPLCPISVATFTGTGIMKIKPRCTKPRLAQLSAAAATRALLNRVSPERGHGIPSLKLLRCWTARALPTRAGLPAHQA